MKILLLEDDVFICEQIKNYFELDGNRVDFFNNGQELLDNALINSYDILLFDINTPKKNGFETLSEIRKDGHDTPVIYLTAQSDIEHVKEGYSLGCSDYIRKPFILEEVELRINQILHQDTNLIKLSKYYSFELSSMELFYKDTNIDLTKYEKDLLYILVKNLGKILGPDTIKDYVWNEKDVCDNTLRTQIKKIRTKIETNFIKNIRNVGYKIDQYD